MQEVDKLRNKDDEIGMDIVSKQSTAGKKENLSKNNKKVEKLKLEMKELEFENERLRKKNRNLRVQNIQISKQAYKWYQQKRSLKAKYQILKVLHVAQVGIDASSQTGELSED